MEGIAALLVNGDCRSAHSVSAKFRELGYRVDSVSDGESALSVARHGNYAVMIIDWSLPGISGLGVLRTLRSESLLMPTLFVLDVGQITELNKAAEAGSLHYLIKPIEFPALLASVKHLTEKPGNRAARLTAGTIEIDLLTRSATRCGRALRLSSHEFRLLEFFVRNADKLVTRQMLLKMVWRLDFDPHTSVVESHVSRLRKRLNAHAQPDTIQTIRNVGYKLVSPI